jgi:hypothetical protein
MPGRRNLARERAQHDAAATFSRIHADLTATFPDHALVGREAIFAELDRLGIRRTNGKRVTYRVLLRWRRLYDFPLLRGIRQLGHAKTPWLTTQHAVTSWLLSRYSTGLLFTVPRTAAPRRSFATALLCEHCRAEALEDRKAV